MSYTKCHGRFLSVALSRLLGSDSSGSMAFIRCLSSETVKALAADKDFTVGRWTVLRVADVEDNSIRTITADQAVEIRESKRDAVLLLVDGHHAGAGMDGIYSAAQLIREDELIGEAEKCAHSEIERAISKESSAYAKSAIRAARHTGSGLLTPWVGFDFLCRVAIGDRTPGAYLHTLGLWPVLDGERRNPKSDLIDSRFFLEHLLGAAGASMVPVARIQALQLGNTTEATLVELEKFLVRVDSRPRSEALSVLSQSEGIWVGPLRREQGQGITGIDLIPWRRKSGALLSWSGLSPGKPEDNPPRFYVPSDMDMTDSLPSLEIRWKSIPGALQKSSVVYRVSVRTGLDGDITSKEVPHSARKHESCRFSPEDFDMLSEGSIIHAVIVVEVAGVESVKPQETEEFEIRVGDLPEKSGTVSDIALTVRTFSEGLAGLPDRTLVSSIARRPKIIVDSKRGFYILDAQSESGKNRKFRVVRPALISGIEEEWVKSNGTIGRWIVNVRETGDRHSSLKFQSLEAEDGPELAGVISATKGFVDRFRASGGPAQIYDDESKDSHRIVQKYLRAWAELLETCCPELALANTVEVRTRADKTIGLIVLPTHPIRVAWHSGYDSLVFHTAFRQSQRETENLRKELAGLDGALFPAFLPNPRGGTFVFADTLGFHAVGMVPDTEEEPKAAVALLARALGERDAVESVPTVGSRSSSILGNEISKFLDCHEIGRLLRIHALRAGEGRTVARALGVVLRGITDQSASDGGDEIAKPTSVPPSFELSLYPSKGQRGIAGRFITDARESRRTGAGRLSSDDEWMMKSVGLPGGVTMPRLRWSRKEASEPDDELTAHIAVAFDTFESKVVTDATTADAKKPCQAFGLLTQYNRTFRYRPNPHWVGSPAISDKGEKHPSQRIHTDMLARMQIVLNGTVLRNLNAGGGQPLLRTDISPEKERSLERLHRLCDWVVTLDRNAGLEYFDAPNDRRDVYDAYVIDAVPEREDIGCLQLITSTSNLDEVRDLLDDSLESLGMSRSRRNTLFLLNHLKALSGRLAIRLTGQKPVAAELIALAVSYANCRGALPSDPCWCSLNDGFIVPVDDVRDLLPLLSKGGSGVPSGDGSGGDRPDLLYVTAPRKGLLFRFIEVKNRRNLSNARSPELLEQIRRQTSSFRKRWEKAYTDSEICTTFRALRRAKLARVLRFYADKARRHGMPEDCHVRMISSIDRMLEKGKDYAFDEDVREDRGWVFCPEFAGMEPQEISPVGWETRVFLFGPSLLPDSGDLISVTSDLGVMTGDNVEMLVENGVGTAPAKPEPSTEQKEASPGGTTDSTEATSSRPEKKPRTQTDIGNVRSLSMEHSTQSTTKRAPTIGLGNELHTDREIGWPLDTKRNPHLLLAGLPGMGKTTCLVRMCEQMARADICPVVFSFHQDIDQKLEEAVGPLRFVDFSGLGFNPLKVIDSEAQWAHLDVAGAMCDIFAAIFPDLGEIQLQTLRGSIKTSFEEMGWGLGKPSDRVPPFGRFVDILRSTPKPDKGLQTLLLRLGELHDYGFFEETGSQGSLWEGTQPTVIRIHATQNDNLQRAFASLVFYGLYKDMFRRGLQDRITHTLVFDEAHRAARLKLIPTMAKECRKYGISLVLASQEADDFDPSLFSAVANYLVLRCTEADAKFLVRNVSDSRHERTLIDRIKQMDKYRALYFGEGQPQPVHIRLAS